MIRYFFSSRHLGHGGDDPLHRLDTGDLLRAGADLRIDFGAQIDGVADESLLVGLHVEHAGIAGVDAALEDRDRPLVQVRARGVLELQAEQRVLGFCTRLVVDARPSAPRRPCRRSAAWRTSAGPGSPGGRWCTGRSRRATPPSPRCRPCRCRAGGRVPGQPRPRTSSASASFGRCPAAFAQCDAVREPSRAGPPGPPPPEPPPPRPTAPPNAAASRSHRQLRRLRHAAACRAHSLPATACPSLPNPPR